MDDGAVADPWGEVVGQPDAVALLRAAASDPTHAYLLVGPTGWGTRAAARAFAGEVLAGGASDDERDRHLRLALEERHPAMTVVEREGASITVDQAREVVRVANLAPAEGSRQVLVLVDLHLVAQAGPALLKTIEEPPPSTFFVLLAEEVPAELVTIASRCVRVEFGPVPTPRLVERLVSEGAAAEVAEAAASSAGGDLDRARLLVDDPRLAGRRAFWYGIPDRLDGTGSTTADLVAGAEAHIDEILAPLQERHGSEMERALAEVEEYGLRKGAITELEARHKREIRRIRTDELRAGLAALAARYRDDVIAGSIDAATYAEAGASIDELAERLVFNPNERLQLLALFGGLPRRAG